ncbi:MAG: S41 family peptidase, partial [Candidatus Paceibacterota bacterium]
MDTKAGCGRCMVFFLCLLVFVHPVFPNGEFVDSEKIATSEEFSKPPKDFDLSPVWKTWNAINRIYVNRDKVNKGKLVVAAINGMLKTLDDPLARFVSTVSFRVFAMAGADNNVETKIIQSRVGHISLKIGYIRIKRFAPGLSRQISLASDLFAKEKPERIILDLRGNSGGILELAKFVCSAFCGKGVLVCTKDFGNEKEKIFTDEDPLFSKMPDVCLINKH